MMPRLDSSLPSTLMKLTRKPSTYLRENVSYTLSGWTYPATFLNLLAEVGIDRIMFSVDCPFLSMVEARTFLERLPVNPGRQGADRPWKRGATASDIVTTCAWVPRGTSDSGPDQCRRAPRCAV